MGKQGTPKADYGKGYGDGVRHAERQREQGTTAAVSDLFTKNPHLDSEGSTAYKEGWKKAQEDSQKKK